MNIFLFFLFYKGLLGGMFFPLTFRYFAKSALSTI